jgi:hypothetical protein
MRLKNSRKPKRKPLESMTNKQYTRRKRRGRTNEPPSDRKLAIYISLWEAKESLAGDRIPQEKRGAI